MESLRTLKIAVSVLSAFQRGQRSDHLGSSNVSYRADGEQTITQRYYPWATIRPGPNNALPTDYTFTLSASLRASLDSSSLGPTPVA